jgi:metallo-beta-lactamase family protein
MLKVTCFGAAGSVTGSNFLVETPSGSSFIVDCGLFQGGKDRGYDPKRINTLILTHAHIDHSGRIPKLVKDGFRGKIIASPPTVDLCEVMLLDSAHVQEMDAEWRTRKNRRRAKRDIEPLYTTKDAEESLKYLVRLELDQVIDIEPDVKLKLRNSGHILGAVIVELWVEDKGKQTKIVFSGDLGKRDQLIVKDPVEIVDADYLFVESTYGDRLHRTFEESKAELLEAIRYAVSRKEKVIIPAFALERTQEVLYVLGEFSRMGKLPDVPIFLDSPLAIKATEIFRKNRRYYDEDAEAILEKGLDPFDLPNLKLTLTTKESMKINELAGSAIIISANGMCSAGRIKHHLKHNLWRPGASVVIMGFQAQGTTGRQIVDGAKSVTIFGEKVAVRAKVFTIGGFSAHADQNDLLHWVGHLSQKSKPRVFVIHGEPSSSQALADLMKNRLGLDTYAPRWKEALILRPREHAPEVVPRITPVDVQKSLLDVATDIQADINRLKERLEANRGKLSQDDIEKLKSIRKQLQVVGSA